MYHYEVVSNVRVPLYVKDALKRSSFFLQELKEQNELLYETKLVLEEQLSGLNSKEERIGK